MHHIVNVETNTEYHIFWCLPLENLMHWHTSYLLKASPLNFSLIYAAPTAMRELFCRTLAQYRVLLLAPAKQLPPPNILFLGFYYIKIDKIRPQNINTV